MTTAILLQLNGDGGGMRLVVVVSAPSTPVCIKLYKTEVTKS